MHEQVHFSRNRLVSLRLTPSPSTSITALTRLQSLYLEANALSSWEDVAPLGELPSLALLNLNFNQLRSVPTPEAGGGFLTLRHLMLRGNPLDSWASIDALDLYPKLTEARLAELPLTSSMSGAAARRVVIARMAKLRSLNGSEVRTREREDAERFYLRQIAQEYPDGGLPADAVVYPDVDNEAASVSVSSLSIGRLFAPSTPQFPWA